MEQSRWLRDQHNEHGRQLRRLDLSSGLGLRGGFGLGLGLGGEALALEVPFPALALFDLIGLFAHIILYFTDSFRLFGEL